MSSPKVVCPHCGAEVPVVEWEPEPWTGLLPESSDSAQNVAAVLDFLGSLPADDGTRL